MLEVANKLCRADGNLGDSFVFLVFPILVKVSIIPTNYLGN